MQVNRHSRSMPTRLSNYLDDAVQTGLRHYNTGMELVNTGIGLYRGLRDLWTGLQADKNRLVNEGKNVAQDIQSSLQQDVNQFKTGVQSEIDRYRTMITQGAAAPSARQPTEEEEGEYYEEEPPPRRRPRQPRQTRFYTIAPSIQGIRPPMHSDQFSNPLTGSTMSASF